MNPWVFVVAVAVLGVAPFVALMIGAREPERVEPDTADTVKLVRK